MIRTKDVENAMTGLFDSKLEKCPVCQSVLRNQDQSLFCDSCNDYLEKIKASPAYQNMIILSVDPGVNGSGVCVWRLGDWTNEEALPIEVTTIGRPPGDWINAAHHMIDHLLQIVTLHDLEGRKLYKLYCEFPQYFDSSKGQTAADSGSLVKLSAMFGAILGMTHSLGAEFEEVSIPKWKAQLSKEAVISRIKRRFPEIETQLGVTTHGWDAVGIGMYCKGIF